MKFGKQIQAEQVPGWSVYYLDYKSLKKIISSLTANRPAAEAAALAQGLRPGLSEAPSTASTRSQTPTDPPELPEQPTLLAALAQDEDRGPGFQGHKTAFFFKLERELEKINAFYLEKEAELKLRLETLLSKRKAAARRVLPDSVDEAAKNHVEWSAVEEGFRLLERDLAKLQQFVEMNATGFRKILKKWDKRSKSATKELYLARQIEVQPVFNRQLIAEMSDTVAQCLLDLTDLSVGLKYEGAEADDRLLTQQLGLDRGFPAGPFHDLEANLRRALADGDCVALEEVVRYSDSLAQRDEAKLPVTRVLWKAIIDAPAELADLILASTSSPFDYTFVDDINGRTCLHEAAITSAPRLIDLCLANGVQQNKVDVYGRSALHYAAMAGHTAICRRLIEVGLPPDVVDLDNCTPLVYAILKGSVDCVRVLLEEGKVSVRESHASSNSTPLSLAAHAGHIDVVKLLLEYGAPSVPNTNGEYPIHLAAQEGHADVCRLLACHEGWDVPDKYNEWTPLFHAARYGRDAALRVLLDVDSRVDRTDELGNSAAYYAAWYGHRHCVALLLAASSSMSPERLSLGKSPLTNTQRSTGTESDIDIIPSLYLPPPMMPYRVYGHNYLDKACLVQVSIGHLASRFGEPGGALGSAVRLRHPLADSHAHDRYLHSSPLLKLVMTATPVMTAAPYSIALPVREPRVVFMFQVPAVSALSLEFSLYPNFGTKTIGRAIALPHMFRDIPNSQPLTLPILDPRLHVIGEISFEVNVIAPFSGVTLEIGGAVETYWKSLSMPATTPSRPAPRAGPPPRAISSAHTSPANPLVAAASGGHALTHSSLAGAYVYVPVQVTRDLHAVVCGEWRLPDAGFELGVADVTLAQFAALARRAGREFAAMEGPARSPAEWHQEIGRSMIALADLMKIIPVSVGVCIEVAYPPARVRERLSLRHQLELNDVVNSVLRTVYNTPVVADGQTGRRQVVFTSFNPDVCASLNWKQPNYPVFLASECGEDTSLPPSATALSKDDARDYRLSSIDTAVDFAKANNLLGILVDARLLSQVPSLIKGVKDFGMLIGAFGANEDIEKLPTSSGADSSGIDAYLQDGVLMYFEHYRRS